MVGSDGDRGQMHTIEGLSAAMLIVVALLFAIQSVSVTSTSASASSAELETNIQGMTQDLLTATKASGDLKQSILLWNTALYRFKDTRFRPYYESRTPPGDFGRTVDQVLSSNNLAYNVDLVYKEDGEIQTTRFIYNGNPSRSAVSASTYVVLSESDELYDGTKLPRSNYPVPNTDDEDIYNIVEVRLTAWRR